MLFCHQRHTSVENIKILKHAREGQKTIAKYHLYKYEKKSLKKGCKTSEERVFSRTYYCYRIHNESIL